MTLTPFRRLQCTAVFATAILLFGFTVPAVHGAKRDLSAYAGKYNGTLSAAGSGQQFSGSSSIRFKTKSSNRGADVNVTGVLNAQGGVPVNNSYNLGRNGLVVCNILPIGVTPPTFPSKYKTRKRIISAICLFNLEGNDGFVRLTIKRRLTKKRAFLEVHHELTAESTQITFSFKCSRRIKKS